MARTQTQKNIAARERREWAHGEMELWLNNDEDMYNMYHRIASNPLYGLREAAGIMRSRWGNFNNGDVNVGRYANFTALVKAAREEHDNKQYGRFESHAEFRAWYCPNGHWLMREPYPASRPCNVTVTEVPTLALPNGQLMLGSGG